MPADEHPLFNAPQNREAKIWRYMDFAQFAHLLLSDYLFFSRADKLGDSHEASLSAVNQALRPKVYADLVSKHPEILEQFPQIFRKFREEHFVNCWNLSEHESFAMWKIHATSNESIAVQSDFASLFEALPKHSYLGLVRYVDYERAFIPENNAFAPVLHKRHFFEYEKEVRAVISWEPKRKVADRWEPTPDNLGIRVKVDLAQVVKAIYISPTADAWFRDLVEELLKRIGRAFPVHHSKLGGDPLF